MDLVVHMIKGGVVLEQVSGEFCFHIGKANTSSRSQDSASPSCLKEAGLSEDCKSEIGAYGCNFWGRNVLTGAPKREER